MRLAFWRRRRSPSPSIEVPTQWTPSQQVFYPGDAREPQPPEPAVSIGFRDGTTVDVEPDSPQGRALRAAAEVLTTRDS